MARRSEHTELGTYNVRAASAVHYYPSRYKVEVVTVHTPYLGRYPR